MKTKRIWSVLFLSIILFGTSFSISPTKGVKNVLLINSYHWGYMWTDSLTDGIIKVFQQHPEVALYIENLNSKQFGQSNFEEEKNHIRNKYLGIPFDGVLTTDNDALDFAFKYKEDLFPNQPIVFSGISNPEDYPLNGSQFYGFTETVNTDHVLDFVNEILPETKRLLVLADLTTTGKIYRKDFIEQASRLPNFEVVFPEIIDLDSIFRMVSSENKYDAIYYIGIGKEDNGKLVDFVSFLDSVCKLVKVPLFANDPIFNGKGVFGGMYQSGKKQGNEAANLLVQLMDSTKPKPVKRYGTTGYNYFFDWKIINKLNIPLLKIPKGAEVINKPTTNKRYFLGLLGALALSIFIVLLLSYIVRKTKKAEKKISDQYKKIHHQKKELEKASMQLSSVISELEKANIHLKETNVSLLEAKKKAEESDNLKSAFLANVSHEIRTPLNSIVGFSSLLGEPDLSEDARNSYIELIESNTESLLVLIDEILDLSKIEAQQLTLKRQDFCIDEMISELFQIFSHSNTNLNVELKVGQTIMGKSLFVFSDWVRVKQIFINLLSNAFKFTDSGAIELGYLLSENQEIILYVKDTGIGIKKEHHQAVFSRFRKLNENTGRIYRGTGLGLAITQKLVELLGGKIWIESEPGKGSTFYFTLQDCVLKEISD